MQKERRTSEGLLKGKRVGVWRRFFPRIVGPIAILVRTNRKPLMTYFIP